MTDLLLINSSALADASVSGRISAAIVSELERRDPSLRVVSRDLGAEPPPHLTSQRLAGFSGRTDTAAASEAAALSDAMIGEVKAADIIVIGAPMYNFGIASPLKAWFDHILRAGITFRYTAAGPEGLLTGKRAIVASSRGGFYSEGPAAASDHQEPHLRTLLAFVGITDVTFVRAEKLAISPEDRAASIAAALDEARSVAARVEAPIEERAA